MVSPAASPSVSQEEILAKIYRDISRLAGEIAIDRCRNRVLLKLVRERLDITPEALDELFRAELGENLEQLCRDITNPMVNELAEPVVGCCGGRPVED